VFRVDANVTACISGLTITGGNSTGNDSSGAGVVNEGTLTLTNCTVSGNSAPYANCGGVWNYYGASLTADACTFNANQAGGFGGAIYNDNGASLTADACTFNANQAGFWGGAIYNEGHIDLLDSGFTGNSAGATGGAVSNSAGGGGSISGCNFSGNHAGVTGGGGISAYSGQLTIVNTSFDGNSSGNQGGGLLLFGGSATVTNCTFSGDTASGSGGGIASFGAVTLTNCTVSGNSASNNGGGLANYGTATLGNTIVAGNTAATGPDVSGGITSQGNNLIGETDGSSGWVGSDLTGTVASPLNPLLAPLGNYGGPTQTMALLPGSRAIDAGNNALIPAGVITDQRGSNRVVNGTVDIGAFESSGFTIAVTSGSGQSTGVLTAFPNSLVATVAAKNPLEPVAGGLVTFTPPASGASATLSGSPATISATGTASVTATANGITGSYSATASGITAPASFSLKNYQLIVALDPSASAALSLAGNASINTPGVVYVDSSSSSALSASGNAKVKAAAIDVVGGVKKSGNASLSPAPVTGAPVLSVASLPLPSTTGMTNYGAFSLGGNSSKTIQPGIYSSISVSGNAKLTMASGTSGIYIIEGGGFSVSGNASVTGSGVMIVNAGSKYPGTGGTYGSISLGGNGACSLSPLTSGPYAGVVFFQPSDSKQALTVTGNASGITGTIYAPAAGLSESGNGAINASLIVDKITISGNGIADVKTAGGGVSGVAGVTVTTPDLSAPSAPAASPASSSSASSAALTALDLALDDLSTTAPGAAPSVNVVSYAPSIDLTRVVFDSPFSKKKIGIGLFQT